MLEPPPPPEPPLAPAPAAAPDDLPPPPPPVAVMVSKTELLPFVPVADEAVPDTAAPTVML